MREIAHAGAAEFLLDGNSSLLSISAARGAISFWAKSCTVARSRAISLPRS
jgi:hypothetical protein